MKGREVDMGIHCREPTARQSKDGDQQRSGGCPFPGGRGLGGFGPESESMEKFGGSGGGATSHVVPAK